MLTAGQLRESITVQSPTEASDGAGGTTTTWADVATVWAQVVTTMAGETLARSQQAQAGITHVVSTWYRSDVAVAQPTWRLSWGSRTLAIQGVDDVDSRRAELRFLCREVQGR